MMMQQFSPSQQQHSPYQQSAASPKRVVHLHDNVVSMSQQSPNASQPAVVRFRFNECYRRQMKTSHVQTALVRFAESYKVSSELRNSANSTRANSCGRALFLSFDTLILKKPYLQASPRPRYPGAFNASPSNYNTPAQPFHTSHRDATDF